MTVTTECSRCSGNGRIIGFSHVVGGRCFGCGGSGKVAVKPSAQKQTSKSHLPYRTFSFQNRDGIVMEVNGITQIQWNGGNMNMRDGVVVNFTMGIPRKLHAHIRAAAGV